MRRWSICSLLIREGPQRRAAGNLKQVCSQSQQDGQSGYGTTLAAHNMMFLKAALCSALFLGRRSQARAACCELWPGLQRHCCLLGGGALKSTERTYQRRVLSQQCYQCPQSLHRVVSCAVETQHAVCRASVLTVHTTTAPAASCNQYRPRSIQNYSMSANQMEW